MSKPELYLDVNSLYGNMILNAAVRYSINRSTYINPAISGYILNNLDKIDDGIQQNIAHSIEMNARLFPDMLDGSNSYHSTDEEPWISLYEKITGKDLKTIIES